MMFGVGPFADLPYGDDRNPQTLTLGSAVISGFAQVTVATGRIRLLSAIGLGEASVNAVLTRVRPLSGTIFVGQGSLGANLSTVRIPFLRLIAQPSARRVYVAEFTVRRFK